MNTVAAVLSVMWLLQSPELSTVELSVVPQQIAPCEPFFLRAHVLVSPASQPAGRRPDWAVRIQRGGCEVMSAPAQWDSAQRNANGVVSDCEAICLPSDPVRNSKLEPGQYTVQLTQAASSRRIAVSNAVTLVVAHDPREQEASALFCRPQVLVMMFGGRMYRMDSATCEALKKIHDGYADTSYGKLAHACLAANQFQKTFQGKRPTEVSQEELLATRRELTAASDSLPKQHPLRGQLRMHLIQVLVAQRKFSEAERYMDELQAEYPAGKLHQDLKRFREALPEYKQKHGAASSQP